MLVTTDNHLGHKEEDPILKMDSFDCFRESLLIGKQQGVDLILQLGDLFHIPEPSNRTIHMSINILESVIGRANLKGDFVDLNSMASEVVPFVMINGNHD